MLRAARLALPLTISLSLLAGCSSPPPPRDEPPPPSQDDRPRDTRPTGDVEVQPVLGDESEPAPAPTYSSTPAPRAPAVTVSVNRGESAGIKDGEEYDVFAQGEAMVDPDTGEVLGSEETKVGRIRISQVLPKFSKADLTGGEARKGDICRPADGAGRFMPHPGGEPPEGQTGKATLAVAPFTFHRDVRAIPGAELETDSFTQKFVTELVKTNKFDVVERSRLETLMDEIQFGESGFADPRRAIQAGKMLGADYFLMGEVSVWTLTTQVKPIPRTDRWLRDAELRLIVDMRIVDSRTSKIVAARKGDAALTWKTQFRSQPPANAPLEPAKLDELQRTCIAELVKGVIDTVYPLKVIAVTGGGGGGGAAPPPPPADTQAPQVEFVSPRAGELVATRPVEVVVRARDDRGVTRVSINGAAATQRGSDYVVRVDPVAGDNEVVAQAWDEAGNAGQARLVFRYQLPDTTPPVIELLAPKEGTTISSKPVNVVARVQDNRGVSKVTINGVEAKPDAEGLYRARLSQPNEGANRVRIEATDTSGNRADLEARFNFDETPPEVEADATILVEGKVDDLRATLTINGISVPFDKTTGKYSARVPADPAQPNKITIVATDEFGNAKREVRAIR